MLKKMLAYGKVYISESRNRAALESIERPVKLFPYAAIVNKFIDTLSCIPELFLDLEFINHICFHPVAHTPLGQATLIAKSLPTDIGSKLEVIWPFRVTAMNTYSIPTLWNRPDSRGMVCMLLILDICSLSTTLIGGPTQASPKKGVILIGATTHWVANYNIPMLSTDIATVRRITKEERLHVGEGYFTDLTPDQIIESDMKLSSLING
ncbi:hypothetical protein V6N12_010596 [Hibiscus sabdariffa]|uniref:Uncharacterized protein n=1 Tax=Hibiscus sabdariffa TaxID=183260 RepID=A0ABR2EM94_9ROSI